MIFSLDSNMVIALLNKNPILIERLKQHRPQDFVLSTVVWFELYFGACKSQKMAANLYNLRKLPVEIVPFTQENAEAAGKIRQDLARQGKPIGGYDVLIAGQALAQEWVLLTHNVREFERVEGLRLEDWLAS